MRTPDGSLPVSMDRAAFIRSLEERLGLPLPEPMREAARKSLSHSEAFVQDILGGWTPEARAIAEASAGLFLTAHALDTLLDHPAPAKIAGLLAPFGLLPYTLQVFRTFLGETFEPWWERCGRLSLLAQEARARGELPEARLWELGAFLALTPVALVTLAGEPAKAEQWYAFVRHAFQGKMLVDDFIDLPEDLAFRCPTSLTQALQALAGDPGWWPRFRAMATDRLIWAREEMERAQRLAEALGAEVWARRCAEWRGQIETLRASISP